MVPHETSLRKEFLGGEPVRQWCYRIERDARLVLTVWGEERVDDGGQRLLSTWLRPATPGRLRQSSRGSYTHLVADPELRPLSYFVLDDRGRTQWSLKVRSEKATVRFSDGTEITVSTGGARFLLGANALPQLAAMVAELGLAPGEVWEGVVFAPEPLSPLRYRLERVQGEITTNLGEVITLDGHGVSALAVSDRGVEARRSRSRRPGWPPIGDDGAVVAEASPAPTSRYSPPPGVRVRDGMTPRRGGTPIGYSVASPARGKPLALALFAGGSGAHDRHGFAGELDLGYHELLDRLAGRGLASLRFDSRGAGATAIGRDALEYGFEGKLADARRCRVVAEREAARLPSILAGHSEGGLVALTLASEGAVPAGVITLALPARDFGTVMIEQVRASAARLGLAPAATAARVRDLEELLDAAREVDDEHWQAGAVSDRLLPRRALARYFRDLLDYDARKLVASLRCPLLIVHGEDDQQVPVAEATELERTARAAGVEVELALIPGANHLLRSSGSPPSIEDYYDRRRRIKREAVAAIAGWVRSLVVPTSP